MIKKEVTQWLNEVSYKVDPSYIPSNFALNFINFIKLVNGEQGEENKTPVLHYKMLDQITGKKQNICNMCYRGSAKTTLLAEYLFLYLAVYGKIEDFGDVTIAIYVSDSIENGVKNMRKNLEYRWENSDFLRKYVPEVRFTDTRYEFTNVEGKKLIVKGYGAKALALDTKLYTSSGYTTIGNCEVGDSIYGVDGKLATIIEKSEIFYKPMYLIKLEDGRSLKVSEDHINSVMINTKPNGVANWVDVNLTTKELFKLGWVHTKIGNKYHKGVSNKCIMKVKNTSPLAYPIKTLAIDPYTLGLILGDGSVKKKASGIVITGDKTDTDFYRQHIPYKLGNDYADTRRTNVITFSIKEINQPIRDLNLDVHGNYKFIPEEYFFSSIEQRLALLRGLLDTDGSIFGNGRITFVSASKVLCDDVSRLVRSLGGKAKFSNTKDNAYHVEIWIGINPFFLPRKANKYVPNRIHWDNCNVIDITPITLEPSQCIAIDNGSHQFIAGDYFRTHNTGVRGAKEQGRRVDLAVLDDLLSDEDARSKTVRDSIEDTVYKAIEYALHPKKSKTIWSGTPFNKNDPLYKAVESGGWYVNVYPVCEEFPCAEKDFKGAWEDRHDYTYVKSKYNKALANGQISAFNQELMLRIMSDEDRLVLDEDITWYKRDTVLKNKNLFNFYITTDFATSEKTSSDYSFISVWAYNSNGDWLWVDGVCKRQLMDKNVDDLFRLAQKYKPQLVGIEVTGQQGGFIQWIQNEMMRRNIYFTLASEGNDNKAGIRPNTNKMVRFNIVVPWFKLGKVWFPEEMKTNEALAELMEELKLASPGGFKARHDDGLDTVSMLASLKVWKPSEEAVFKGSEDKNDVWELDIMEDTSGNLHSYIV